MKICNVVDTSNYEKTCGYLVCENEALSVKDIQNTIDSIIKDMEKEDLDWTIIDLIDNIPEVLGITFYTNGNIIRI